MFARLDDWLIKRFEPVAHWIAHNTGISNYTVAMALLVIWPATVGADAIAKQTPFYWVLAGLGLIVASARYVWLLQSERQRTRNATALNTERIACYWWRSVENVLIVLTVVMGLMRLLINKAPFTMIDVGIMAVWAHLYFAACSQPPPNEWRQPKLATQGA